MKYRITHKTSYSYNEPVSLCHNEAHLILRDCDSQTCTYRQLQINPLPAIEHERIDFFGNVVNYFSIQAPHTTLTVSATSEIQIQSLEMIPNLSASPPGSR
jgi:transglutaminase-like putative cysteine protease